MSAKHIPQGVWDVVYLLSCAVESIKPDAERVSRMDLDEVYLVSSRHCLEAACAVALESVGVRDDCFAQALAKAIRKSVIMDAERSKLFSSMDLAGIWYLPLKGCVLQRYYPVYGMRQMSDNDILFDASHADAVRTIMESQGFTTKSFGRRNVDVYQKKPVSHFEMHRSLFSPTSWEALVSYYSDFNQHMIPNGDRTSEFHLSNEDCYIYLVAHEFKHYKGAGTGLRSLLDIYVFMRAVGSDFDWGYALHELRSLGLLDFEARNRGLALRLFGGKRLTSEDEELLVFIVSSGAYGTIENKAANQLERLGRWKYLWDNAFPSMQKMKLDYPILRRVPCLLPACWVARLIAATRKKPRQMSYRIKAAFHKYNSSLDEND